MRFRPSAVVGQVSSSSILVGALVAILLFLFAVQLLGAATAAAAPVLERLFRSIVVGDASALGLSWLVAYVLANGSVTAALALSLFTADLLSVQELFLMIVGSRLGAAAIVVFIGALDFLQKKQYSLQQSISMGLLTFLLTHSIYIPVAVFGYLLLPSLSGPVQAVSRDWTLEFRVLEFFAPVTAAIVTRFGPTLSFLLAIASLFGSLKLFDRLLARADTAMLRRRFFSHLQRTWVSFVVGLVVTSVTTSVAFSLGVIVPLYNRGYVKRDELIPYVLGANLGTLFDTLVVALVLETTLGVVVVLELLVVATLVTLVALLFHGSYSRLIVAVDDRLLTDRRLFVAFVVSLLLVPLALLIVPLVVA
jgi:sodium-dependent phosphate cotransporter